MSDITPQRAIPPVATLIGALLALNGITSVIRDLLVIQQMNLRQSPEFVIQQSSSSQWWLSFLMGLLSVVVGLGLLRGARWARLGAMAMVALVIAEKLVTFFWPPLHELYVNLNILPPKLWFALQGHKYLIPMAAVFLHLLPSLLMLLFLATPSVRAAWHDEPATSTNLLDRWGGALEKRLPAGLPIVVAFIALYLICGGLVSLSPMITDLLVFRQQPQMYWRDDIFLRVFIAGSLIVYLGFIFAGVALLWRARWAKVVALYALVVAVLLICNTLIYSVIKVPFITGQKVGFAVSFALIVNGGTFLLQVVTYFLLAVFLLRALAKPPVTEEVVEAG